MRRWDDTSGLHSNIPLSSESCSSGVTHFGGLGIMIVSPLVATVRSWQKEVVASGSPNGPSSAMGVSSSSQLTDAGSVEIDDSISIPERR